MKLKNSQHTLYVHYTGPSLVSSSEQTLKESPHYHKVTLQQYELCQLLFSLKLLLDHREATQHKSFSLQVSHLHQRQVVLLVRLSSLSDWPIHEKQIFTSKWWESCSSRSFSVKATWHPTILTWERKDLSVGGSIRKKNAVISDHQFRKKLRSIWGKASTINHPWELLRSIAMQYLALRSYNFMQPSLKVHLDINNTRGKDKNIIKWQSCIKICWWLNSNGL